VLYCPPFPASIEDVKVEVTKVAEGTKWIMLNDLAQYLNEVSKKNKDTFERVNPLVLIQHLV